MVKDSKIYWGLVYSQYFEDNKKQDRFQQAAHLIVALIRLGEAAKYAELPDGFEEVKPGIFFHKESEQVIIDDVFYLTKVGIIKGE